MIAILDWYERMRLAIRAGIRDEELRREGKVGRVEGGVSGETLGGPVKPWETAGVSKATWYRRRKEPATVKQGGK